MEEMVNVIALKAFPNGGVIQRPGPARVPASKVTRLVEKKIIAPPDGRQASGETKDGGAQRVEGAIARISGSLSVERVSGESTADFLERLADKVESQPPDSDLPEDFPMRELLAESGYASIEAVKAASDEDLLAIDGIGDARLKDIRKASK
jgi:hypothetical protein